MAAEWMYSRKANLLKMADVKVKNIISKSALILTLL